ncbi:MAG TPA: TolC family protein, partial [Burkholderiales bacterium]|nr:TolC family protein [Burkholderiales bacterium]
MARRLGLVVIVAALAGCALKSPPERAEVAKQALPNLQVPAAWNAQGGAAGVIADKWLAGFNDPQLDALVQEALANNPDLQVAAGRVEQAAAFAKVAGATLYPQVNALARGGGALSGDSSGLEGAGIFASWEIDLWGRVRSGRAAARDQ